jgi:hypothetical protein
MVISHKDSSMISKVRNCKYILEQWIPTPAELNLSLPEDKEECKIAEAINLAKFGSKDWYDWRIKHWGVKWDPEIDHIEEISENEIQIHFQSAWAPPIDGLNTLHEKFGFQIDIIYNESGTCFCGEWENGVGKEYQYDSNNLKHLPDRIDESFCISQFYDENF